MLLAVPTSSTSGTTSVLGNIGEMENKGIEFTLNTVNVTTRSLKWTTSINIAHNRNKVLKLDGEQQQIFLGSLAEPAECAIPGKVPAGAY